MKFRTLSLILVCFCSVSARAAIITLDDAGETYPVIEPDVIVELQEQAKRMDIAREKEEKKNPITERIKTYQPWNIANLPKALSDREFLVDMTYTLDRDLMDADGNIIFPRGYTINPLDYTSFPGGLVIIDGSDQAQVKWFKQSPYFENYRARLLISDGYAFNLTNELQRPVFYLTQDIAERLKLSAVPSIVVQEKGMMKVREVFLKEEGQ